MLIKTKHRRVLGLIPRVVNPVVLFVPTLQRQKPHAHIFPENLFPIGLDPDIILLADQLVLAFGVEVLQSGVVFEDEVQVEAQEVEDDEEEDDGA